MGKVLEIGICKNKGDKMIPLNEVQAIKGEGLVNDRKFKKNNNIKKQLTLIEIENINYYNKMFKVNIPAINFRRNIKSWIPSRLFQRFKNNRRRCRICRRTRIIQTRTSSNPHPPN